MFFSVFESFEGRRKKALSVATRELISSTKPAHFRCATRVCMMCGTHFPGKKLSAVCGGVLKNTNVFRMWLSLVFFLAALLMLDVGCQWHCAATRWCNFIVAKTLTAKRRKESGIRNFAHLEFLIVFYFPICIWHWVISQPVSVEGFFLAHGGGGGSCLHSDVFCIRNKSRKDLFLTKRTNDGWQSEPNTLKNGTNFHRSVPLRGEICQFSGKKNYFDAK